MVPFERQLSALSRLPTRNGKWLVDIAWVEPRLISENAILLSRLHCDVHIYVNLARASMIIVPAGTRAVLRARSRSRPMAGVERFRLSAPEVLFQTGRVGIFALLGAHRRGPPLEPG